ncbi:MurR/RpiR family transcriptional regulator [Mycoplasmopsis pulmonis]|uniref:MurR/RpiR family transcriptional regulator n=1 Tax=Mycoplasmopsis pulmonis TaxID=2107 RepID=UPI001C65FB77|nr:MurR/RpiR family transcriptional regulator [Mycoplasmopsis pulmonis]
MINNLFQITKLKIKDVALGSNCSQSSVINFVKKMKCNSFKEMLFKIDYDYSFVTIKKEDFQDEKTQIVKWKNYNNLIAENIDFIYKNYYLEIIKIVGLLKRKNKIFLFGKGSNIELLSIFGQYLNKKEFISIYSYDIDIQEKYIDLVDQESFCFFFSFSGNTKKIVEFANKAKEKKAFIIHFSANPNSEIIKVCNIFLLVKNNEDVLYDHTNARISFLYIIMNIINLLK